MGTLPACAALCALAARLSASALSRSDWAHGWVVSGFALRLFAARGFPPSRAGLRGLRPRCPPLASVHPRCSRRLSSSWLRASPVRRARLPSVSGRPSGPAAPLPAPRFGPSALLTTAQQQNLAAAVVAAAVAVVVAAATAAVVAATAAAAAIVAAAPAVPAAAAAQQENQDNDPPAAPAETTIVTTTHDFVTSHLMSRSQRPAPTPPPAAPGATPVHLLPGHGDQPGRRLQRRRGRSPFTCFPVTETGPDAVFGGAGAVPRFDPRPAFFPVSASYYVGT